MQVGMTKINYVQTGSIQDDGSNNYVNTCSMAVTAGVQYSGMGVSGIGQEDEITSLLCI